MSHVCCIIPSRMLRHLADQAEGDERAKLLDSALISEHLRGQRSVRSLVGLTNAAGEKRRTVYDAKHRKPSPLAGKILRGEGGPPSSDATGNAAYDNAGVTYDFYSHVLKRNSIDGRGMRLDSYVHFGKGFNNAFWDGAEMVYGDGDQKIFTGFATAVDVVAHELTHGVTQFTVPGGLDYQDQSGALNESFSDCFGSVVKQWKLQQSVTQADWLIGEGIMAPAFGKALRSMAEPGNQALTWSGDDQPATMKGYVAGGDVHTNSGIPNHAFQLAAMNLGGNSWEKAGPIWYRALPQLTSSCTFLDAAKATIDAALALFGPTEQAAVQKAWKDVGVI